MNLAYPDSFEDISTRFNEVGISELPQEEKVVYCIWWFEAEINNGGFHQFFTNSAGDNTKETLESLELIKALKTKKLLEQAIQIAFNNKEVPKMRDERNELLDRPSEEETEQLFMQMYKLDQKFFEYEDSITDLVNEWLLKTK